MKEWRKLLSIDVFRHAYESADSSRIAWLGHAAGPALSLPSMIALTGIMGIKKTIAYCSIVAILSTIAGMGYGWLAA